MAQASDKGPAGLDRWLLKLGERDMPVLAGTVARLCDSSGDQRASAGDLAGIVLRDAAMTSGVLRIANSAYYNASGYEINTISRAVVVLGFETVRSIGLSLAVIDTFLRGTPKSRVIDLMRQAVYAAVQAKVIAQHNCDPAPEQIFIAALLYRLGDMAFWSFAAPAEADALAEALEAPDRTPAQAEQAVLGCTLRQITAALARQWHLGETLEDSFEVAAERPKGRAASVVLGHELEAAVREHGWDSAAAKRVTERIGAHTRLPGDKTREIIDSSRDELKMAAEAFGFSLDLETGAGDPRPAAPTPARLPDPMLQLKILREISSLLERKPAIQLVLDMIMEGIYRGVAMDRTLLAVLTPDRQALRAKYVLGDSDNRLGESFRFKLGGADAELMRWAMAGREACWAARIPDYIKSTLLPAALRQRLAEDFFIGPLVVRGREIGLIYADCRPSAQPLTSDTFEGFRHFIEQANLSLAHLTR